MTTKAKDEERAPAYLAECRTLTGLPLAEAFAQLDRELPPQAYKPISGGKGERLGLTDIGPGFLPAVLLELFGPMGVGWGFEIVSLETRAEKTSNNNDVWAASARLRVWYAYEDAASNDPTTRSTPIEMVGGSDNSEIEWANKGAITNALGTAWFFLGYQLSVFQGLRSHKTAGVNGGGPSGPAPAGTVAAKYGCPECGKDAIIEGKPQYGGGFVCFKKKGGCGAKFETDPRFAPPAGAAPSNDRVAVPPGDPSALVDDNDTTKIRAALWEMFPGDWKDKDLQKKIAEFIARACGRYVDRLAELNKLEGSNVIAAVAKAKKEAA